MQSLRAGWIGGLVICFALPSAQAQQDAEQEKLFENHVRPVLVDRCIKCHGPAKSESGLRLDKLQFILKGGDSGAAIKTGDSAASLLLQAMDWNHDTKMPPDKQLDSVTIDAIKRWIDSGAYWPEQMKLSSGPELRSGPATAEELQFWSLLPLKDSLPKSLSAAGKSTTSLANTDSRSIATGSAIIDAYIQEKLIEQGLNANPPADRATFIRRLTFDLTGLPPIPDEVSEFVDDKSPGATAKLVERLLQSNAYGERWGRHWLDVVRYSDSAGETADYPVPDAWKYRNYVIDAFNKDKPYNQFLHEQIAGDILARDANSAEEFSEKTIATGYIAIARRFGFDSENYHHLTIQDTIDTLGQSTLGMSFGCARCHDHKFDPVSMDDYYAMYGIFESTLYPLSGSEQKQKVRSLASLANLSDPQTQQRRTKELAANVATLKRLGKNPPPAILRSLTEMDGDFELQSPAAGGSRGVLVAPWLYDGPVSVTNAAQSPFADLFPSGKVGVSLPAGKSACRVWQSLNHRQTDLNQQSLSLGFDLRVTQFAQQDNYSISLTDDQFNSVVEIDFAAEMSLKVGTTSHRLATLQPGMWYQFQFSSDPTQHVITGVVIAADKSEQKFEVRDLSFTSSVAQNLVIGSGAESKLNRPTVELDNVSVVPLAKLQSTNSQAKNSLTGLESANSTAAAQAASKLPEDPAPLRDELKKLIGIDGDFEFQEEDKAPTAPWGPGPNSVVKISKKAQSPLPFFSKGELGVLMPNRAEYDGFGMQLEKIQPDSDGQIYAFFEFCCANQDRGGEGSWRYYLGHGPGNSAAIELFFNGTKFFRRSADAREPVAELKIGRWYQVLIELNTIEKSYRGWLKNADEKVTEFAGAVASGWDGVVDYTFIDSYGHLGGVRPELFADNFYLIPLAHRKYESSVKSFYLALIEESKIDSSSRRSRALELRNKLAELQAIGDRIEKQLQEPIQDMAYAVAEGTPHDVHMQIRGEPSQPGRLVSRNLPALFASDSKTRLGDLPKFKGSGRLELAKWLTEDARALTARVMVNRVWQQHFGRGLVRTENDFGTRGEAPTHPELLDWLACRFIESGWSIKHLHRLIVHTKAYQQASTLPDQFDEARENSVASKHLRIDPDNRHLWRFSPRRLSAEEIRDAMLMVSGMLDKSPGREHPFPSPHSWGFTQHSPFYAVYESKQRSIYLMQQRLKRHPFLGLFDGADPNVSTARRELTTVPTQALYLMNNPFVHEAAQKLAERFSEPSVTNETDVDRRISSMFYYSLGRPASQDEIERSKAFVTRYSSAASAISPNQPENNIAAWSALARSLITRNEFLFVE
ncbi:MAG: PSD1 and planctomycete cytochrome C domain-containing protein [Pirellulales bacterium]